MFGSERSDLSILVRIRTLQPGHRVRVARIRTFASEHPRQYVRVARIQATRASVRVARTRANRT